MPQSKTDNTTAMPSADTGNASNPSPHKEDSIPGTQLIDKKGEKYLRESANIEDEPDAQDQQDLEDTFKEKE